MKYMLLLYEQDKDWDAAPESERQAALAEHEEFTRLLRDRGIEFSGGALRPSTTATTLRPANNEMIVTDGPYVEQTEHIGGYYVIEAADLDQALDIARQCPTGTGTEVRPMWA